MEILDLKQKLDLEYCFQQCSGGALVIPNTPGAPAVIAACSLFCTGQLRPRSCPVPRCAALCLLPPPQRCFPCGCFWAIASILPHFPFPLGAFSTECLCGARDHCRCVRGAGGSAALPEPLGLKQQIFPWPFVATFGLAGAESSWASLSWRGSAVLRSIWKEMRRKFVLWNK